MTPIIYSVMFRPLRMALKAFHDLAAPNKALSLISHLNAYSSAALDSLRFLICHILSCLVFLLVNSSLCLDCSSPPWSSLPDKNPPIHSLRPVSNVAFLENPFPTKPLNPCPMVGVSDFPKLLITLLQKLFSHYGLLVAGLPWYLIVRFSSPSTQ